ncbi:glycosyltransferase [Streptomyces gossypiisoli]|uniref:glycosyltransferase n=1 Tax=Streptomyces gossypiisoli TaxID=2748864 RepID=UPI002F9689A7
MSTALAVALALANACAYVAGTRLQHQAVHRGRQGVPGAPPSALPLRFLVRHPRWLVGLVLLGAGGALHIWALQLAPVTVVQPLGVCSVVLGVVWGRRERGARLPRATVLTLAVVLARTGTFTVLAARVTVVAPVTVAAQWATGALALLVVAGCCAAARPLRGPARCLALGVGAGSAYGCMPVLVRASGAEFGSHGVGLALLGTLGGLAAAGLVGFLLVQRAHAAGPPEVTVACLTVVDPFVAVAIGVGLLGEAAGLSPATALTGLVCWALSFTGVVHITRATPVPPHVAPDVPRPTPLTVDVPRPTPGRSPYDRDRPLSSQEYAMPGSSQEYALPGDLPRPQRILIAADTFPPDVNGAANFAHRLAEGLTGRGHEVHVMCPAAEAGPGSTVLGGTTVHRLPSHRTPFHATFRVCLPWQVSGPAARLVADISPDVVHIQSHFPVCRAVANAAHRRGVPVVATNHFMPENLLGYTRLPARLGDAACRFAWRDLVRVFRRAHVVTAPTPRAVRLLHDNGLDVPARPVSCGLDLARFAQPGMDHGGAHARVLFVGRLDEEKNVHELLRALARLPGTPDVRAEIVGDGSCRRALERLARELGIRDRVTFHGLVSDQEVLNAYARCDVFCMPGTAELQSLATMEAMAAGKPVVAADAMALPHLVRPGHNGWLFPPGDIPALAAALGDLIADPAARRRMGEAGREIVAGHDIRRTLSAFEDLYLQAAGRPAAAAPQPHLTPVIESEHDEYAARSGRR